MTTFTPNSTPTSRHLLNHCSSCRRQLLRERGNFLPHAAVLTEGAEGKFVAGAPPREITSSTEVLPMLHDGLRIQAKDIPLTALGEFSSTCSRAVRGHDRSATHGMRTPSTA